MDEIVAEGGRAIAVEMDVAQRESVNNAIDMAEASCGTIEVLVNNAGVADTKNFLKITESSRDYVMGVNFNGVWNVAQEVADRLVSAGKPGSIINIGSVLGLTAHPGQTAYCASKAAVVHLTKAMSIDLMRHQISVNAIAPGWFKTEMNEHYFNSPDGKAYVERMPARRLGNPEELLGAVILLASDAGSFINGVVLPVDGAISVLGIV